MADNVNNIMGNYAPEPDREYITTPLEGLRSMATNTSSAEGCVGSEPRCPQYDGASVLNAVKGADIVIVCLGTG